MELSGLCCVVIMSTPSDITIDALEALERATARLEKALHAREKDAQEIKSLRSSKESLEAENLRLRETIERERERAREDGGRIIQATEEIRSALSEA